jgi:hypothetical protein
MQLFICVEQKKTKKPNDVLAKHKAQIQQEKLRKKDLNLKLNQGTKRKSRGDQDLQISSATKKPSKTIPKRKCKVQVVEKVKYNFGKDKK